MKNQEIEKLIRDDLRQSAPDDFAAVRSRVTPRAEEKAVEFSRQPAYATQGAQGAQGGGAGKGLWKRLLAIGLAFLVLASAIIILITQFVGGKKIDAGYFVIDVNPSIQISYDEDGIVTEAEGLNLDGKTLLVDTQLVGKDYGSAIEEVFDRCVTLGYFNASRDNNAILVSANKSTGGSDATLLDDVKQKFTSLFSGNGMQGAVLTGAEETQSLTQAAEAYGIDAQKYALITSALALGVSIDEAEYATLSISALYARIQEKITTQWLADVESIGQCLETELTSLFTVLEADLAAISAALQEVADSLDVLSAQLYLFYKDVVDGYLSAIDGEMTLIEKQLNAEMIMHTLDEMRRVGDGNSAQQESLVNLLHQTHGKMQLAMESIGKKMAKINYAKDDPEALDSARKDKFHAGAHGESEFDFTSVWQEIQLVQTDEDFYSTWYAVKQKWKEYRVEDLR